MFGVNSIHLLYSTFFHKHHSNIIQQFPLLPRCFFTTKHANKVAEQDISLITFATNLVPLRAFPIGVILEASLFALLVKVLAGIIAKMTFKELFDVPINHKLVKGNFYSDRLDPL